MFGPRKDQDKRWNEFPDVTVTIEGGYDISSNAQDWQFKATRENVDFLVGANYRRIDSARRACYRALQRNTDWMRPLTINAPTKRAQVFGAIEQPDGALAEYLADWTAKNS